MLTPAAGCPFERGDFTAEGARYRSDAAVAEVGQDPFDEVRPQLVGCITTQHVFLPSQEHGLGPDMTAPLVFLTAMKFAGVALDDCGALVGGTIVYHDELLDGVGLPEDAFDGPGDGVFIVETGKVG